MPPRQPPLPFKRPPNKAFLPEISSADEESTRYSSEQSVFRGFSLSATSQEFPRDANFSAQNATFSAPLAPPLDSSTPLRPIASGSRLSNISEQPLSEFNSSLQAGTERSPQATTQSISDDEEFNVDAETVPRPNKQGIPDYSSSTMRDHIENGEELQGTERFYRSPNDRRQTEVTVEKSSHELRDNAFSERGDHTHVPMPYTFNPDNSMVPYDSPNLIVTETPKPETLLVAEAFVAGITEILEDFPRHSDQDRKVQLILEQLASQIIADHVHIAWHDRVPRHVPPVAPNPLNKLLRASLKRELAVKESLEARNAELYAFSKRVADRESEFLVDFNRGDKQSEADQPLDLDADSDSQAMSESLQLLGTSAALKQTCEQDLGAAKTELDNIAKALDAKSQTMHATEESIIETNGLLTGYMDKIKTERRDPSKDYALLQELADLRKSVQDGVEEP